MLTEKAVPYKLYVIHHPFNTCFYRSIITFLQIRVVYHFNFQIQCIKKEQIWMILWRRVGPFFPTPSKEYCFASPSSLQKKGKSNNLKSHTSHTSRRAFRDWRDVWDVWDFRDWRDVWDVWDFRDWRDVWDHSFFAGAHSFFFGITPSLQIGWPIFSTPFFFLEPHNKVYNKI